MLRGADLLTALNAMRRVAVGGDVRRGGKPLDARGLAQRLSRYGIGSKTLRVGEAVFRGYDRGDFEDAWTRYPGQCVLGFPVTSVTALQRSSATLSNCYTSGGVTDDLLQATASVTQKTTLNSGCNRVTDVTGKSRDVQAQPNFTPPAGPDRCSQCGWHPPTQGHKPDCPANRRGAPF